MGFTDAGNLLNLLLGLQESEGLCVRFLLDSDNRLVSLFWMSSRDVNNYKRYGDVLLFDNTYKNNRFQMILVIFPIVKKKV